MPTENRSSNSELSKIVTEALVSMVSGVTGMRPPADEPLPGFIQAPIDRAVARISSLIQAPTQQRKVEPILLTAVATLVDHEDGGLEAHWLLEGGTAELFAGMTLLVADNAPDLCTEDGSAEVYTHADFAEIERLRAALKFYADREHYHFESGSWDTVSGEPLNILWCGDEPDFIEDGTVTRNALAANVEPSAPAAPVLTELTDDLREILGRPNFTCHYIAKALRLMGLSIAPKSEDEQAVVIHWLLGHYLKHGASWRQQAEAELKAASEELKA